MYSEKTVRWTSIKSSHEWVDISIGRPECSTSGASLPPPQGHNVDKITETVHNMITHDHKLWCQ